MSELRDRLKTALADRYSIEREIGAGGMAMVYPAEDRPVGRISRSLSKPRQTPVERSILAP